MVKMNDKEQCKHKKLVPIMYASIWTVSLVIGLLGNAPLASVGLFPLVTSMHTAINWAFWTVYFAFIAEFVVSIFDMTIIFRLHRFQGTILFVLLHFAVVAFSIVFFWIIYDRATCAIVGNIFLALTIIGAILQKFQTAWLPNNIDKFLSDNIPVRKQTISA